MVYCIGLTGDIASGKSTVAALFSQLGIDVINADKIARELTQRGTPLYQKIVNHYGTKILNLENELDRRQLRDIIFSNPLEREWLEHLLHPSIRLEIGKRVFASTSPYCIAEIPLLISKQNYPYINQILLITSPSEIQISRIMQRDQCTLKQAQAVLAAQPSRKLRLKNADDRIVNDSGLDALTFKVKQFHRKYVHLSELNSH